MAAACVDSRGVLRGSCLQLDCNCSLYCWSTPLLKCTNCGHPPGMHQKVSGFSTGNSDEETFQAKNLHNTEESTGWTQPELLQYMRFGPQEENSEWNECSPRSESLKELALLTPKRHQNPQQSVVFARGVQPRRTFRRHMSQKISLAANLQCLGCNRQKWQRKDGTYYDFCGKTCRDQHLRKAKLPAAGNLQCPGCGNRKYLKGDGTYYDYCSKSCREAYQSQPQLSLGIRPQAVNIVLLNGSNAFAEVSTLFHRMWCPKKGQSPEVDFIFRIQADHVTAKWQAYRHNLSNNYVEKHFHGTTLLCTMATTQQLCSQVQCGICSISKGGFDARTIGRKIKFQRFGHGFYLAPNSSKCHDYTEGTSGYRAMLLCEVCPGRKHKCKHQNTALTAPPRGYDCVYGIIGGELNYEEITFYNSDAILPKYIIMYRRDGIKRLIQ